MEAQSVGKAGLIFLAAVGITVLVLLSLPRRIANAGGCGPRALHAAAALMGATLTEQQTLDLFPNHGFEVMFSDLERVAPKLGLVGRTRQMSLTDLKREKPIGVLHIDGVHFAAVVGYEGDAILIVESVYMGDTKPVRWLLDDLKTRWDGAILVLTRN